MNTLTNKLDNCKNTTKLTSVMDFDSSEILKRAVKSGQPNWKGSATKETLNMAMNYIRSKKGMILRNRKKRCSKSLISLI